MRSATRLEILGAAILTVALVLIMAAHSFATPISTQHSQREVQIGDVPILYLAGYLEGGKVFKYHDDVITNLTIQPLGASQIWDRSMTFCGDISSKLRDAHGPVVIFVYKRVQSRSMCYDLLSVYDVDTNSK